MTRTLPLPPLQAEATAGLATDFGIIHCGVSRMVAASATHPTAPQAPEPFRDPPGEAIGVATSAGQAEGEIYALLFGSGFIVQVMSSQHVDAKPLGPDPEIWTIELP